jgi:transketolase
MPVEPLVAKWESFGWWVKEIDGHDMRQIVDAFDMTDRLCGDSKPKCIVAHTTKGYGISNWEASHAHLGRGEEIVRGVEEGRAKYGKVQ